MIKKIKIRIILKRFYKNYKKLCKLQKVTTFEKEYIERLYKRIYYDNKI